MLTDARGLSDHDPAQVGEQVMACWDAFLDVVTAASTDLSRPSRLPGWSGRDVLVHLGGWPDHQPIRGLLDSARDGGRGPSPDPDAHNADLLRAHAGASEAEVVQALVHARQAMEDFFQGPDVAQARDWSRSTLGRLPVLSLVHAAVYELAVHARDLAPCGAPAPDPLLLDRGLAALLDVTGALAARQGVALTLTASAPGTGWRFTSGAHGWTTEPTGGGRFTGTGVSGSAGDLLDTSAGRTALPAMLLSRRLVVQDLAGFLRLAPLLDEVPGLPGGAALRGAVGGVSRLARLLRR